MPQWFNTALLLEIVAPISATDSSNSGVDDTKFCSGVNNVQYENHPRDKLD